MKSAYSPASQHRFYIVFYSYLWWYQPIPGARTSIWYCNLHLLVMISTHSQASEHWFYIVDYNYLWWYQLTPMCENIDLCIVFCSYLWWYQSTPMCQNIHLCCILRLLVMISTHSHVSEHWFNIVFYNYFWWYQPTPMCQNIDFVLYFAATCEDVNLLPCVRTFILYYILQLLVMISTHSPVSEHGFYIVFRSYLWR